MDIGDKVSEEGEGNGERPDDEPLIPPVVQVHHLIRGVIKFYCFPSEAPFQAAS